MEKKKLLLVAVSVGVFLVIVVSAAILIFTPKAVETGVALSSARPIPVGAPENLPAVERTQPATVDAADMVRNADGIQGIQPPPQAAAFQENHFYINGENAGELTAAEIGAGALGGPQTVITVPKPSTAAVPDTPVESAGRSAPRQTAAPAARPAPARTSAPAAARPAARPATAEPRTYNDYWVQTGAFTAKVRAEGVKETLASKGITSIIENREVDGRTWYRVRVGPYTSENEANYWLALVKSIDGFGDSQVRMTSARR
jgi:DedD protein